MYLIEILHQTTTIPSLSFCRWTLYLIEILHQTTTIFPLLTKTPQLYLIEILHQTTTVRFDGSTKKALYLIEILHQTTTGGGLNFDRGQLYLIEILHQTTTGSRTIFTCRRLYLIEILHQTTTRGDDKAHQYRCILSKFYIKPQQLRKTHGEFFVVSYRNSTSNHNTTTIFRRFALLYLIEILHQTTTVFFPFLTVLVLYLIEILHQTTTHGPHVKRFRRCILSKFYIKPQPPA